MLRRTPLALALAATVLVAIVLAPRSVVAHGNIDQYIEGEPGCNTSNFAGAVTANGGQRQSFIPTGALLSSVGLCVSAAASNTNLIVGIYGPGGLIGGGSSLSNPSIVDSVGPPVRYVHVDFLQPITVSPGALHTIEIQSGATITWYGTTSGSPYSYCQGAPNSSAVGDFGFLTYVADSAAGSAPCPEPPTATPVPATNTPIPQPTNTPVPGVTNSPTNTPALGETTVPQPTSATGVTAGGEQPPVTGSAPAPAGGAAGNTSQPSASGGQALPNAGGGEQHSRDRRVWIASAVFIAAGGTLFTLGRRRRA